MKLIVKWLLFGSKKHFEGYYKLILNTWLANENIFTTPKKILQLFLLLT